MQKQQRMEMHLQKKMRFKRTTLRHSPRLNLKKYSQMIRQQSLSRIKVMQKQHQPKMKKIRLSRLMLKLKNKLRR